MTEPIYAVHFCLMHAFHEPLPSFGPLEQEDYGNLEKYEMLESFEGHSAPEILARLEWRDQRSLSQLEVLLHNIGLTPLQKLVIVEAFDQQQIDNEAFLRAGLGIGEEVEADEPHPAQQPLAEVTARVTYALEDQLTDDEAEQLFAETARQSDLRGMSSGDLMQLLDSIHRSYNSGSRP